MLSSFLGPTANSAIEGGGQRQSPFSISFLSSRLGPFEDLLQLVLQLSEPYLPSSSSIRSHPLFNQTSLDEPVTLAFPQIRINFRNDSLRGAELLHIIDTLR